MSSLNHGYWKSLRQLEEQRQLDGASPDDGAGHDGEPMEFPESATDAQLADPMSRRNLFHLMGASLALAGVAGTGCKRWEKDEIVPLARRPEDQTPGVSQLFATMWDFVGYAQPLFATSYEGRPIKVDGNPTHPWLNKEQTSGSAGRGHGPSTAFAQGSILHLYDPDRSTAVLSGGNGATFDDFVKWLSGERAQMSGARVRFLSEACSSPTVARLRAELEAKLPSSAWYEWEPVSFDSERAGLRMALGQPMRTLAHLDRCQTILTLDCDLFVEHPAALRYSREWAKGRNPNLYRRGPNGEAAPTGPTEMNRLYAVESHFTPTGAVADHRLPLRSELILPFLNALDARLSGGGGAGPAITQDPDVVEFLDALAEELNANRTRAVVLAGRRQPPAVHALVARINQTLGAVGATLDYLPDADPRRLDHLEGIAKLSQELEQGLVDHLFIIGGNPAWDAPADLDFAAKLAMAKRGTVHLSEYANETSKLATWHIPRAHYLESWGDGRTYDGTYTLAQPLVQPMYGGISTLEMLELLLDRTPDARAAVEATQKQLAGGVTFRRAVHDGFVAGSAAAPVSGAQVSAQQAMPQYSATQQLGRNVEDKRCEVVFVVNNQLWDGRFANNPWMQETPDFLTKITWDNYAIVGPSTAKALGITDGTFIRLELGGRTLELPATTLPGQAPFSIAVVLGGGRTAAGKTGGTGKKSPGFDVNVGRTLAAFDLVPGVAVRSTGKTFQLANVQEHWDIREGLKKDVAQKGISDRLFDLVREARIEDARGDWNAERDHHFPLESLFEEKQYPEQAVHRWGMTIDLGACHGCNACMVACQSENNVPVVGKSDVIRNREMHWIRIDRYFSGSEENPQVVHQPLGCVHCENAPCEQVCPVGATLHSSEGLNDMVYNRCVGTRYCLNNCSYRVRRFNFFDYQKEFKEARNKVRRLLFNPEVTVRHRGVMEKCTYCVQRIQNVKIAAKNQRAAIEDGDIVTACQQACPTEAIVFGDLSDKNSRVYKLQTQDRREYELLGELNTKPRTHYLARIRNPNPRLEKVTTHGHGGH